ncbi:MAG: glycosyltransferase family 39 protein [Anaerolineales bacterium]|nr:glycosyltransferase family 39 protein [Anaerolineales bacterium]
MTSMNPPPETRTPLRLSWRWLFGLALGLACLTLLGAWASNRLTGLQGWEAMLASLVAGALFFVVTLWLLRGEALPGWLVGLALGAAVLRLAFGVLWYLVLPTAGYDSPAECGGYVMADAYNRDRAAWRLANSPKPLWKAVASISRYRKADQYGGMLYLSALTYRYAGGAFHQPLQVVALTAAFSALAVLFAWAFARRAWGERVATLSAWGLALYPEALLLGSSQMREAFLVTLVAASFYGLLRYVEWESWRNLLWVLLPLLISLAFSPPVAAFVMLLLVLQAFLMGRGDVFHRRGLWILLGVLAALALAGIWLTWRRLAPPGISNPFALIAWWVKQAASLQARTSHLSSGWMQKIFGGIPAGLHWLLLLLYGVSRPLLPAALVDISSAPVWRAIAIWRALGWTVLLPFLVYAPVMALRRAWARQPGATIALALSAVVWLGILGASLRAGADLWDNPRYRVMFAGLQVSLAAWVWVTYRQVGDTWLKKTVVCLGLVLLWFVPWYLRRYLSLNWPVEDFFKTLGLGVVSSLLYLWADWLRPPKGQT